MHAVVDIGREHVSLRTKFTFSARLIHAGSGRGQQGWGLNGWAMAQIYDHASMHAPIKHRDKLFLERTPR